MLTKLTIISIDIDRTKNKDADKCYIVFKKIIWKLLYFLFVVFDYQQICLPFIPRLNARNVTFSCISNANEIHEKKNKMKTKKNEEICK